MPALSTREAAERLAEFVARARPSTLAEIFAELYPDEPTTPILDGRDLTRHIKAGLEAEEIVDLWNVVFPEDRNVWYDEEAKAIRFNEEMAGFAD